MQELAMEVIEMTAPTQRLTQRAAAQLSQEVTLAVRVRKCSPAPKRNGTDGNILTLDSQPSVPATFPAGGLPVVPIVRSLTRAVTDLFTNQHHLNGVLAFTQAGERILMGRSRFRSLRPTGIVRRFPTNAVLAVNEALLAEELIPELTVDDEHFIVNSVDFKVLMAAVVTGKIESRYLAAQLKPFYDRVQSLATYEPDAIRSAMESQ